ncbi:hypothetical protein NUW58_g5455 [Xylaria curta]|uniref:Uncharacterized protein n=1 Tax=Xylaria curta TaxID=42375 RepID=A0ACC1P2Z9_9PEZI|nr:hypothetical protein NUW58_g5455 [Xylaria curta]
MDTLSPQHIQGLIQAAVDNASATLTAQFNAKLDKLRTQNTEFRAQIAALQSAAASRKPRPVLPNPPLLTGPAEFDVWLPLLQGKLRVDGDAIGSDEAKFIYVWEAGTTVQPDILRIQDLRAAISNKLQGKVDDRESLPEVYDDFVALLLRLGGGYGGYSTAKPGSTYPSTSNTSTPMDISQVRIDSIRVQSPLSSDTESEAKVQISSIWTPKGQMATSSTRKERSQRRKRGNCERCGGTGHGLSTCPLLPYREYVKFNVDEGVDDLSD